MCKYLYKNKEMLGSIEFVDDESIKDIVGVRIRKDHNSNPSVIHSHYTKRWKEEILNNMDSMSNEEIKNALQQLDSGAKSAFDGSNLSTKEKS